LPDLYYPSLYSFDDIGESSLPEALAWDKINSIPYQTYYNMGNIMPWLEERHTARNRMSQDYQYVLDRRKRNEEMSRRKEISLSVETRRREREKTDRWRLELENNLRLSKGEPILEKISDLKKEETGLPHNSKVDTEDPIVIEAGEILVDFIDFLQKGNASR